MKSRKKKRNQNSKSAIRTSKAHIGTSTRRVIKLFLVNLAITLALAGWLDYSSYEVFNPLWTLLIAVLVSTVPVYHGQSTRHGDSPALRT